MSSLFWNPKINAVPSKTLPPTTGPSLVAISWRRMIADSLTWLVMQLGMEDPLVQKILAGRSPRERATEVFGENTITSTQIADNAVTETEIAPDSIGTGHLQDAGVTTLICGTESVDAMRVMAELVL